MLIEQAVFASPRTEPSQGCQLLAASPGLTAADARELCAWGPGDGTLCGRTKASTSVNFHPLPSGASCVGYSVAGEADNNGRDRLSVYTQCLVVPLEELARFANNPFALLRAARAQGMLKVYDPVPASLAALQLPGHAAPVDEGLLGELVDRWGPRYLAWLVQTALAADALVVVGTENADWLVAGLLNCLPVECRPELSFATGLTYSQRRPYRLNTVFADATECRRIGRQMGVTLLNLNDRPSPDFEPTGWAAYLEAVAEADQLAGFAAELNRPRAGLRISDLSWLASQLTDRLHANLARFPDKADPSVRDNASPPLTPRISVADFSFPDDRPTEVSHDPASGYRHAHRAHARPTSESGSRPTQAGPALGSPGPSALLAGSDRALLEKLEHLDDLVFDTIGGKQPALDELTRLWPSVSAELPAELLAESREQYLRYALSLWNSCESDGGRDPQWAVAALDVLCVLFSADY